MLKFIFLFLSTIVIMLSFLKEKAYSIEGIVLGSLSEMYDDNIYALEEKESDFITEIIFGLGLRHVGTTTNWQLIGQSIQQIYYKSSELNNNAQSGELNIASELTNKDRINIINRFNHYYEVQTFNAQFGTQGGRNEYYTNTATATYISDITSYLNSNIRYTNIYTKIVSSNELLNDSVSHSCGITLRYEINSSNIIYAVYNYTYWKALDYIETENETRNENIELHNCGLGYEYHFTRQLFMNLQGGIDYIITEDERNQNIYGTLSLTDQIDQRNNLNISVSRRYEITPLTNQVYDVWNFSLIFLRELSYLLNFSFTGFYQYGNLVSDITTTKSELIGVRTGLNYLIFSDNARVFLDYIYTKNTTKQTTPINDKIEYDRNQIRIGVRAEI